MGTEPLFKSPEVAPGDLCRAIIYDDPEKVAEAMFVWMRRDVDEAVNASQWIERLADRLAELGRGL